MNYQLQVTLSFWFTHSPTPKPRLLTRGRVVRKEEENKLCQITTDIYLWLYQLSHSTCWQELRELVKWRSLYKKFQRTLSRCTWGRKQDVPFFFVLHRIYLTRLHQSFFSHNSRSVSNKD